MRQEGAGRGIGARVGTHGGGVRGQWALGATKHIRSGATENAPFRRRSGACAARGLKKSTTCVIGDRGTVCAMLMLVVPSGVDPPKILLAHTLRGTVAT